MWDIRVLFGATRKKGTVGARDGFYNLASKLLFLPA